MAGAEGRGWRQRRAKLVFTTISPFTVFLLGFGFALWLVFFYYSVVGTDCHVSVVWLDGWSDGASLLQMWGYAIAATAALFLTRLICLRPWRRAPGETLAQAAVVIMLIVVFGGIKAHMLPYGFPSQQVYDEIHRAVYRSPLMLVEEEMAIRPWRYDHPESPPHPWDMRWPKTPELFPNANSPTHGELVAAKQCAADYNAALAAYRAWEDGFEAFLDARAREGKSPVKR